MKFINGTSKGTRAVRWNDGSTAAIELGNLGTDLAGVTEGNALAINYDNSSVGYAEKYVSGVSKGARAVRWDSSSNIATELASLSTDSLGWTTSSAVAINAFDTAVGSAYLY